MTRNMCWRTGYPRSITGHMLQLHAVQLCIECMGHRCRRTQTQDHVSTCQHLSTTSGSRFRCTGFHVNLDLAACERTFHLADEQKFTEF